ncbi:hypothetical protein BUALT_Bualt09G0140100 [Buddleja alternifolia]|uniref:Uncharacterized protein n=1 Tax=Buddleja alternifolia TaxID=168488 RepID=A0AAV6X6P2_9LAMI|nr:hypothetical protein BUALT_Bualt09G0140100 [Buddleja alternifolia]
MHPLLIVNVSYKLKLELLNLRESLQREDCTMRVQGKFALFFRWCKPYRAIWSPSGIPVTFPLGDLFSGAEEEVEDDDEVVSGVSRVVGSQRQEIRGNYVHFSWMICAILFTMLVVILFRV